MSVLTIYYSQATDSPDEWNEDATKTLARTGFTYDVAPAPIITIVLRDPGQVQIPTTATLISLIANYQVVGADNGGGTALGLIYFGGIVGSGDVIIPSAGADEFGNATGVLTGMSIANINAGALGLRNYNTAEPYPARIRWWIFQDPNTKYCYATVTFTLAAPIPVTGTADSITTTTATLRATVDPQGANADYPVSYHFEYGLTAAYGTSTPTFTLTGTGAQAVSAAISGLTAATTYHFRVVATNADNTTNGADNTLITSGAAATGSPMRNSNIAPRRRF